MITVKVYEDGRFVSQVSADAASVLAITDKGENTETCVLLLKGNMNRELFSNALASSCVRQIFTLYDTFDKVCKAMSAFVITVKHYGLQYLTEIYGKTEEAEDGKL